MQAVFETLGVSLLSDLSPDDKGDYYLVTCPSCGAREAFVYKNNPAIFCNRKNDCGYTATLWDFLALDNERYRALLERAGIAQQQSEQNDQDVEKNNVFENAAATFQATLFSDEGNLARSYLLKRGYTESEIHRMGVGCFTREGVTVETLGLAHIPDTHKIVIPARDVNGNICGWSVRRIDGESDKKYLNAKGKVDYLFNFHNAKRERELIFVEGYLDALIAEAKGIKGVVAVGTNGINRNQVKTLRSVGKRYRCFLAFDADESAGAEGTYRTLHALYRAGYDCFVMTYPKGYKDLDELLRGKREEGSDVVARMKAHAIDGVRFAVAYITGKHGIEGVGRTETLVAAEWFQEPLHGLAKMDFTQALAAAMGTDREALADEFERYNNEREEERRASERRRLTRALQTTDDRAERVTILDALRQLESDAGGDVRRVKTYDDIIEQIRVERTGFETGISAIDDLVTIPAGATTIIAARPRHGKTTLLVNMCLRMIAHYPGKRFVYMSYEESASDLFVKMLMNISGIVIHGGNNFTQYKWYVKNDDSGIPDIEQAKGQLREYMDVGRLTILDDPIPSDGIASFLRTLGTIDGVFIDYIQKIPASPHTKAFSRQLEIQRISADILHTAISLNIPVILGAQLGRGGSGSSKESVMRIDNLREAGDIEQDANLIFGLWREGVEEGDSGDGQATELRILKNRNGNPFGKVTLAMHNETCRVDA